MGYLGSKGASGAYQAIIASMPAHEVYIETHLGSGAVMDRKPQAARSIGIDIDPDAIARHVGKNGVELYQTDAVQFLQDFDYSTAGRTLVYCDPPYLEITRTSRTRYKHEYDNADHIRLLTLLCELRKSVKDISIMLSGYPSALYDDMLPDWRTKEFQVMTRGGPRTEKLWMSFEQESTHWATFAGKNFTDRQRIKRKARRWADNYRSLSVPERTAILAALLECDQLAEE